MLKKDHQEQQIKIYKSKAYKDRLRGHKDSVIKITSPAGSTSGILYSASKNGIVRVWDLVNRKIKTQLRLKRFPTDTIQEDEDEQQEDMDEGFQQDNQQLQQQQQIKKETLELVKEQITAAGFSQSSVYAGFSDGLIFAWNLSTGELVYEFEGHTEKITEILLISPSEMISCSNDKTIRVWDLMVIRIGCEKLYKLAGCVQSMQYVKPHSLYALADKQIFYDINYADNEIVRCICFNKIQISSFYVHQRHLIFGTIDSKIEIYDIDNLDEDLNPIKTIQNLNGWILKINSLDEFLYTGCDDKTIKVWNLEYDYKLVEEFVGHEGQKHIIFIIGQIDGVISLEFADSLLYSGSYDHTIRSWNIEEMRKRIKERNIMFKEDVLSRKVEVFHRVMSKKKKRKKGKKGKKKK